MSGDNSKASDLENERVAEKRYAKKVRSEAQKQVMKASSWAGHGPARAPNLPIGELFGRVALSKPDSMLFGRNDFYIGERHTNVDGVEVYSWAAPIACTFYRQNHQHSAYEGLGQLCDDVAVIRTFTHSKGRIHDFTDDIVGINVPPEQFARRGLNVPAPPSRRPLPGTVTVPGGVQLPGPGASQEDWTPPKQGRSSAQHLTPVRAEAALRAQLRVPRTKSLASVLATMQPDQYELVTLPAKTNVVIEGQPGTGKTIVAAHRAAYLVNDETPDANAVAGTILLVGPTSGYSNHVRSVVQRLADRPDGIKVLSLPELMKVILGRNTEPTGTASTSWRDVDHQLGLFARSAIRRLKDADGVTPTIDQVYEYLRRNGTPKNPVAKDADWGMYLWRLPSFREALPSRMHATLLAFIKWLVSPAASLSRIELVIVDEAQDVSGLEWLLLEEMNRAQAWTIIGDLHQRRSDHTPSSWESVFEVLAIDVATPIRTLKRGYRSTKPILEFASRLLPRRDRSIIAFQEDGPLPVIQKVEPKKLGAAVVRHVERLHLSYPQGTVAVIGADTTAVVKSLHACRWRTTGLNSPVWELHEREVSVMDADSARGLEFDAVIVVEPAHFAVNLGRSGPLYTALTRPNRELIVVHSAALPKALVRS